MGSGVKLGAITLGAGALVAAFLWWRHDSPKTAEHVQAAPSDAAATVHVPSIASGAVVDTGSALPPASVEL